MNLFESEILDKTLPSKILSGDLEYVNDYFKKNPDDFVKNFNMTKTWYHLQYMQTKKKFLIGY